MEGSRTRLALLVGASVLGGAVVCLRLLRPLGDAWNPDEWYLLGANLFVDHTLGYGAQATVFRPPGYPAFVAAVLSLGHGRGEGMTPALLWGARSAGLSGSGRLPRPRGRRRHPVVVGEDVAGDCGCRRPGPVRQPLRARARGAAPLRAAPHGVAGPRRMGPRGGTAPGRARRSRGVRGPLGRHHPDATGDASPAGRGRRPPVAQGRAGPEARGTRVRLCPGVRPRGGRRGRSATTSSGAASCR